MYTHYYLLRVQLGARNHGEVNVPILKRSLLNARQMRFQSMNAYRRRFKMRPYKSFMDLTGDQELATELESLYGHIDAVEFYVGKFAISPYTMRAVGIVKSNIMKNANVL